MSHRSYSNLASRLLNRFVAANGAVVTKEALLFAMYGDDENGGPDNAVDVLNQYIFRLRRVGVNIKCHWGLGYSLDCANGWLTSDVKIDDMHVVLSRDKKDEREFQKRLKESGLWARKSAFG